MSIYPNATEKDLNIIRNLAEQQINQRDLENENRILKQTHDIKLAGNLSPVTKNLDTINENTKKFGEIVKKSDVEDGNGQKPGIENLFGTQSIRDTLALMRRSKFFLIWRKINGDVFWKDVFIQPLREK